MAPKQAKSAFSLVQRATRVWRSAHSDGFHRLAYRLARRTVLLGRCLGTASLTLVELHSAFVVDLRRKGRLPRGFQVRAAVEADLPALAALFGPDRPVAERLSRGDTCLVTVAGGQIGAATWFAVGPKEYDEDRDDLGCVFRFPQGVCFSYDGLGTRWGAWGALMSQAPVYLEQWGVRQIVTAIDYENDPSIKNHLSLGYRRVGLMGCLRLAGRSQPFCRGETTNWRMLPGAIGPLELCLSTERARRRGGG